MSRKSLLGLAAVAAIGASLAMTPSANAFHGGSSGGGFFGGGSHGSHGGSFGGLFHRHHGSSGGSHGDSSSCGCDCNDSKEANEGDHEDNDHHAVSDRDERSMDAPSHEVRRDANGVIITEGERDGRHHDAHVNQDSGKDKHQEKNADHKRDEDHNKDKDTKKDDSKDSDKDKEKKNDSK